VGLLEARRSRSSPLQVCSLTHAPSFVAINPIHVTWDGIAPVSQPPKTPQKEELSLLDFGIPKLKDNPLTTKHTREISLVPFKPNHSKVLIFGEVV